MKMKRVVIATALLTVAIISIKIVGNYISKKNLNKKMSTHNLFSSDISKLTFSSQNDIKYLKSILDMHINKSEIQFNKTTEQQLDDKFAANIFYQVEIKNISTKEHNVDLKLYIDRNMCKNIVIGGETLGPKGSYFNLKSGQKIVIDFGPLIRHPYTLNSEDENILYKYKDQLIMEVALDGKIYTTLLKNEHNSK